MSHVYVNSSPTAVGLSEIQLYIGSSFPRASSSACICPLPAHTFVVTRAPRDQYVTVMIRREASAIGMLYSFDQYNH